MNLRVLLSYSTCKRICTFCGSLITGVELRLRNKLDKFFKNDIIVYNYIYLTRVKLLFIEWNFKMKLHFYKNYNFEIKGKLKSINYTGKF